MILCKSCIFNLVIKQESFLSRLFSWNFKNCFICVEFTFDFFHQTHTYIISATIFMIFPSIIFSTQGIALHFIKRDTSNRLLLKFPPLNFYLFVSAYVVMDTEVHVHIHLCMHTHSYINECAPWICAVRKIFT